MSKEKLHVAEIVEQLAENLSLNKRVAEDFVKVLIATVEEALMANDTVKLKGFGTFKLQWNNPRKSVDVNTSEEIIINGYYKVVFTPDVELKELVNEPYAHLEPVLLSGYDEESTAVNVDDASETTVVPLKLFNEQANEIKDILSEISSLGAKEEKKEKEEKEEKEKAEVEKEHRSVPVPSENYRKTMSKLPPEGKSKISKLKTLDFYFIGIMLVGLLIYILIDFNVFSDIAKYFRSYKNAPSPAYFQPQEIAIIPSDTIPLDTLSIQTEDSLDINETVVQNEKEPVDNLQVLSDEPRVYNEFIATEEVIPGSRLTRISERHYGVKELWVYIYEANKDKFTTPDQIAPGTILKIPKLNPVLADISNPRCLEYALYLHDLYLKK